ncbi:MAG: ASKHA domain-containing protein [Candidatus Dehalobacter alkaniphilus]
MTDRKIVFYPEEKMILTGEKKTILEASQKAGIAIEATCGGKGTCGKCRVRIQHGAREPLTNVEENFLSSSDVEKGIALACQCRGYGNLEVFVPEKGNELSRKLSLESKKVLLDTDLRKEYLELEKPHVHDFRSDANRLIDGLKGKQINPLQLDVLSTIPFILRENDFKVTAVLAGNELLVVEAGDTRNKIYGVALDIGTTTVVGFLLDLCQGLVIGAASRTNKQNSYGADVISRIQFSNEQDNGLKCLQEDVLSVINEIINELTQQNGIDIGSIYQVLVVGNTVMSHLFLGLSPAALGKSPFIPAFSSMTVIPAYALGLEINHRAQVIVLPNIAGYVGSDTVAALLAVKIDKYTGSAMMIDLGTNGEIALACDGRLYTCSTAAGPAFEGAHIYHGMRAVKGAIEKVRIDKTVTVDVIGNVAPCGICGSGLIDAVSELVKAGIINNNGRIMSQKDLDGKIPEELWHRLRPSGSGQDFVLHYGTTDADDIVLTQRDVRELQMAKASVRAGAEILLKEAAIKASDLNAVMLAGAFGSFVRKESILSIGMLPRVDERVVYSVGNAAGEGAILALSSENERNHAQYLARKATHVELSLRADFNRSFRDACAFM